MTASLPSRRYRAMALPVLALAGAVLLAACGSSSKTSTPPVTTAPSAAGGGGSDASVTVSAANVPGVGTVLVDGNGRTLYVLASEQGGKVSCVAASGCTGVWPPVSLPSGMAKGIAGSGVQASRLGTATSPSGDVRVTYGGWPLYTFTGDSGSGMAKGQGVKDAWGQWWVLSASGSPVTAGSSSTSSTTAPQSGGAGF